MALTTILDAAETLFFERELEHVKTRTYDIIRAPLKAFELIPVSTEAGNGAKTITYYQYDATGLAKVVANYATDFPSVNALGRPFTSQIRSIGASYSYSLQEIRASQMVGKSLDQREANNAARAHREAWNRIAFYGDTVNDLQGLLSNLNIPESSAPAGLGLGTEWTSKTPDEILADMNALANGIPALTNGAEQPDTIVLPINRYTLIASTARSANSDTTILDYFIRNNPFISQVEWANELTAAEMAANGLVRFTGEIMFAYRKSPDVLTLEMPVMFEQMPLQVENLVFRVPCHSRIGGVLVYYPLACAFMDSI